MARYELTIESESFEELVSKVELALSELEELDEQEEGCVLGHNYSLQVDNE